MRKSWVLPYTAGIVDGEGHISLQRRAKTNRFHLRVCVTNTNEWLCEWLKMQFGGRTSRYAPAKSHWKPPYRWQLEAKRASDFLKIILPYLQLKKAHAEIAIEYQAKKVSHGRTEEQRAVDEAKYLLMQNLNKRGV